DDAILLDLIFRTHVRHHGQSTVAPQLPFRPESMRCIHRSDDQCAAQWSYLWNGPQKSDGSMFPTFTDNGLFGSSAESRQLIQFFIETFHPLSCPRLAQFLQPLLPLRWLISFLPPTCDASAAINRFDPNHRALRVVR